MANRVIIVDTPEIAARGSILFPGAACFWANGQLPPEAFGFDDSVVASADPQRIATFCPQLAEQGSKVRQWHADLSGFHTRQQVLDAAAAITAYTHPAPPQEPPALPPPSGGAVPDPAEGAGPLQEIERAVSAEDWGEAYRLANLPAPPTSDAPPAWMDEIPDDTEAPLRSIRTASALKRQAFETEAEPTDWPEPADFWASRPLPEFDAGWILPCVRPFVTNQAAMIGCDPGITWLQTIAFAAGCLSDDIRVRVRPSQDWAESARIWACVVGDSGDGKSPSMRGIMREASELNAEIARRSRERQAGYKDELELHEMERKAWLTKRQKGEPAGPRPIAPAKPVNEMLYFSSTTSEGLLEQQEATTRGAMCYADEFLGWLLGMDQYKAGGKGSDRQFWLSSWDGAEFVGILVGKLRTIPNTGVTIVGGSQPDAIRRASSKHNLESDGLLQRVLVYHSAGEAREDAEQPADRDAIRRWRGILHRLYAMKTHLDHCVFSEAAHRIRAESNEWITHMRGITSLPAAARQALSKWRAYLPRIALTLHAIEAADNGCEVIPATIEEHTMTCAWEYMRGCLWPHLLHLHAGLDQGDDATTMRAFAEYVLARDLTHIKPAYLSGKWSHYQRRMKTIQLRREFWDMVVQSGWARPCGGFDRTGSISAEYQINPLALDGRFAEAARVARDSAERYRTAMHPAMIAQQGRQPGED